MKKNGLLTLSCLILVLLLSACSSTTKTPQVFVTVKPEATDEIVGVPIYPYPKPNNESYPYPLGLTPGYPVPNNNITPDPIEDLITQPTRDLTLSIVRGVLLLEQEPVSGAILFLSDVLLDSDGEVAAVVFNRSKSIQALSDENGVFVFINIPLGKYGLVLDTVREAYLLNFPTGDPIIIDVTSPENSDLGILEYDDLPIQP